jgi:acyl carrier protein
MAEALQNAAVPVSEPEAPVFRNDLERRIATAFAEVLGLPRVGTHDNFFERGGDSLMAAQLTTRLRPHVSVPLRVKTIFRAPTVARLTRLIEEELSVATPPLEQHELPSPAPRPALRHEA